MVVVVCRPSATLDASDLSPRSHTHDFGSPPPPMSFQASMTSPVLYNASKVREVLQRAGHSNHSSRSAFGTRSRRHFPSLARVDASSAERRAAGQGVFELWPSHALFFPFCQAQSRLNTSAGSGGALSPLDQNTFVLDGSPAPPSRHAAHARARLDAVKLNMATKAAPAAATTTKAAPPPDVGPSSPKLAKPTAAAAAVRTEAGAHRSAHPLAPLRRRSLRRHRSRRHPRICCSMPTRSSRLACTAWR